MHFRIRSLAFQHFNKVPRFQQLLPPTITLAYETFTYLPISSYELLLSMMQRRGGRIMMASAIQTSPLHYTTIDSKITIRHVISSAAILIQLWIGSRWRQRLFWRLWRSKSSSNRCKRTVYYPATAPIAVIRSLSHRGTGSLLPSP